MRRDRSCLTWFVRAWTKLNKQTDLSGVTSRRLADPATSLASNTVLRSSSFIDVVNIYDTSLDFFSQTTQFKNVFLHVSAVTLLYVKHLLSSDHGSCFFFFFFSVAECQKQIVALHQSVRRVFDSACRTSMTDASSATFLPFSVCFFL